MRLLHLMACCLLLVASFSIAAAPVVVRFEWVPSTVEINKLAYFYWDIQNVRECYSTSSGSQTPALKASSGTAGPATNSFPYVGYSRWYCIDLNGNRYPSNPNEFIEAQRTVEAPLSAPEFIRPAGSYISGIDVGVQASSNVIYRYTIDGSPVSENSPILASTIILTSTTTLKVRGFRYGFNPSPESAARYTILAAPIVRKFQWIDSPTEVNRNAYLHWDIANVKKCYSTTSGSASVVEKATSGISEPATNSFPYTGTSKWYCIDLNDNRFPFDPSQYIQANRIVEAPLSAPQLTPTGGVFMSAIAVKVTPNSGVVYRYTTDGSDVTATSSIFPASLTVNSTVNLKVVGFRNGFNNSAQASENYQIGATPVAPPAISPNGGIFTAPVNVTLSSTTSGATLRYTTDGSDVSTSSTLYSAPFTVNSITTVKAKSFKTGMKDSVQSSASFTVNVTPIPETPVMPTMATVPTLAAIGHEQTAGVINGVFQVSASGAATYNIPLLLPTGIAGTTPQIAFSYNSQSGNGPLGVGWQVSGLSGISRCRKTLADDGFFAAIEFNQQDAICLDGQRLVLISGSEWSDQAIYHTKIESMQRVRLLHVAGKIQFAVDRADGSTYFYGQTLDSVQQDQQSGQIYVWHLSAITDASGNTVNFSYINADRHQAHLSKIKYAGNTIDFVYDNLRTDKKSGYFQGNKFFADLRLNDVIITNHQGAVTGSYYLQYDTSVNTGASLLNSVQQCNGKKENSGGECLKTTFHHDDSAYTPSVVETFNLFSSVDGNKLNEVRTADINGDGRNDYIVTYGGGTTGLGPKLKVFIFGKSGFYEQNEYPTPSKGSVVVKDIDGNGASEIIVRNYNNTIETETIYRWVGSPNGGELSAEVVYDAIKNYGQYSSDIDGNGLPDREEYLQRWLNKNNSWEYINGFDGFDLLSFLGYEDFDTNSGYTRVTHEIVSDATGGGVDFNSDGIPDIFNVTSRSSITIDDPTIPDCAGSNICRLELFYDAISVGMDGSHIYIKENLGKFGYSGELSDAVKVPNYVFPDINGDGNADVFDTSGSPNTINQGVLKGVGLISDAVAPPPYKLYAWYADVNMDGADDYIFKPESGSSTGLYYKTFDSINNVWSEDISLPNSVIFASKINGGRQNVSFTDIDGDGLFDFSVVDLDAKTIWVQSGANSNIKVDLVKSINVGNIKGINITYLGAMAGDYPHCSSSSEFYTGNEITCVYVDDQQTILPAGAHGAAVLNLKAAQELVYNVEQFIFNFDQSSTTQTSDINYHYKGYRVHAGGVGSLGFESILIHNKTANTATVSEYFQNFPFTGILKRKKSYFSTPYSLNNINDEANLLSDYSVDELTDISLHSGKTRFISVGRSQSTEYTRDFLNGALSPNNTKVKTVIDERVFTKFSDSYVNLTSETISTTDETTSSKYIVTTVSEYENENVSNWWIGKPTKKVVTHQRTGSYTSGSNVVRTMGYTYYPSNGLLESETIEPDGDASNYLKTHFVYDSFGNKTAVTQCSLSFSEQCDAAALPSTLGESADVFRRTVSIFDTDGRYLKEVQNAGLTNQYFDSYNMHGQPTSMRQVVNNVPVQTDIFYDDFGKEYFRRSADGSAVSTAIARNDGNGPEDAAFQITVLGNVAPATKQYIDGSGNTLRASTQSFDGRWVHVDAAYNSLNQKIAETVPYFSGEADPAASSFEYDKLHRLIRQTAADATVSSFEYSVLTTHKKVTGNYTSVLAGWSASINLSSSTTTNAFGNTVKVVDEHGQELSFSYDAVGNADLLTGVDGVQIDPEFDSYGRRTALKDPNKGDWYFSYNGLGELIKITAPDDIITEEFRDNLGRVRSRTVTKGSEVETSHFVYDGQKLTEEYITGGSRQGFGYDALGRVSSSTTTIDNLTFTTSKTYDQYGRTFQHFDASGNSRGLRYGYNNYGYLEFMREAANGVDGIKYYEILAMDERGNVTSSQAGNGLTTLRNFDQKTGFIKDIQTGLVGQVQSLAYEFDGVGNLRARIDYNNLDITDTTQSLHEEFEYDDLNRLTKVKRNLSGNLLTTQEMSYAHNGNILSKSDVQSGAAYNYTSKPAACSSSLVGGHSVQSIGQLSYCYDGRGNQTHSFNNGVQQRTVVYSAFDLPTKITSLTGSTDFTYDVQRKRIKRVDTENAASTTTYYLDSVEYILRPNGGSEYKRYLGNAAIEIVRSNGTKELSYLHQDHLGSLDVISNSQGQKTECLSFDAFGKRRQCSGWNPVTDAFAEISLGTILAITPRGFTGHEHIDHAEVIHMNGRIYDPKNGRFMQADPIVQAPDHSQSPNRYSYVFNNPLSYTDPTGFEAYVINPWSDWLPVNGDWLSTMYRLAPATTRLDMKKYKKLDGAYGNHTPVDSNTEDGAANKVDSQQTGPTEVSDVHLGDGTLNEIDGPYSKPQVTAPHKQILAKGDSRRLTADEIKLAMKIFGTAIDYSKTKIFREKAYFFQPVDRAMAPDGNIYFHPDSNDYYDDYSLAGATVQHTFIHELVHVWQHQHGVNVRKAAMSGYDYWPMKTGRSFSSYNLEQQAQMVADYFMLKEHGLMWKSLSNQNPAPKAQDYEKTIPFEYKK